MCKKDIKIIIATHKQYRMPTDNMYLPLHIGAEGKFNEDGSAQDFGYTKDNTGENISDLNPYFCELTGLYWAWKNLKSDYIGLVHYRRHFCLHKTKDPFDCILSTDELMPMLGKYKIIIPKKRKYYIETIYSHYAHTFDATQLDVTRKIIEEKHAEYLPSFDRVVKRRSGYMFNMMIMPYNLMSSYCEWLFDILFELKNTIDISRMNAFEQRFCGRISEIIFNVWLDYQLREGVVKKSEIKELPCIYMEKVNWWKKGTSFLKAKFFDEKYDNSF